MAAQTITEPPVMVQLIRRAGNEVTSIPAYTEARAAVNVFGMTSLTGPAETWLVETHDSFGSIEAVHEAVHAAMPERDPGLLAGDVLGQSKALIAVLSAGIQL